MKHRHELYNLFFFSFNIINWFSKLEIQIRFEKKKNPKDLFIVLVLLFHLHYFNEALMKLQRNNTNLDQNVWFECVFLTWNLCPVLLIVVVRD